jgi:hypothetical protein
VPYGLEALAAFSSAEYVDAGPKAVAQTLDENHQDGSRHESWMRG